MDATVQFSACIFLSLDTRPGVQASTKFQREKLKEKTKSEFLTPPPWVLYNRGDTNEVLALSCLSPLSPSTSSSLLPSLSLSTDGADPFQARSQQHRACPGGGDARHTGHVSTRGGADPLGGSQVWTSSDIARRRCHVSEGGERTGL